MRHKPSKIERASRFVADMTFAEKEKMWMENLARNMANGEILDGRDIRDLPKCKGSAIVVGAGASVERHGHLKLLSESGYDGTIIATDRMLVPCLKSDVSPSIVITADGASKISKFYDDSSVELHDAFGPNVPVYFTRAVLNVFTHPETIAKIPYAKHFYLTPFDDPLAEKSLTRAIHFMTRKTILNSLGCVGGQAFNLAYFLQADPVILVGMDYGYPPDTPPEKTSYYPAYAELAKRRGKKLEEFFTTIKNPDTSEEVMIDANWSVYREIALNYFALAKCKIVNCSPISSLFGKNVQHVPLREALEKWGR